MRNLKKLFAVIMTIAMLASLMVPALAADGFNYEADAKKLYDLGLFKGTSATSYVPDLGAALIRETGLALMIRAAGLEAEVEAMTQEEVAEQLAKIVDADEIAEWAKPYAAYAVKTGLTNGIDASILPNVKFGAKVDLSGRQFITFLLRVMGYDNAWDDALTLAVETGMLTAGQAINFGTTEVLNRDGAVGIMAGALKGTTSEGITLAQKLVDAGVVSADAMADAGFFAPTATPTPTPVELVVDSVTADNLKTVTVVFNNEVDKDTIKAETVKVVKGSTNVVFARTLLEDNKTLVIELNTLSQSDTITITIEGVKDADGMEVVKFNEAFVVNDVTVPSLLGAKALNPKQVELQFNEPVQLNHSTFTLLNDIKLNNGSVVARAIPDNAKNTVLLEFANGITEGTHTLEVKGVKDFANITAPTTTLDITVVKDETPPVAVEATVKSNTQVEVKFDESLSAQGSFKVNGTEIASGNISLNARKDVATISGLNLGIAAILEVRIEYKGQKDIMGNEVKDWTTIITAVADDSSLPTVELTKIETGNKLTFTFSKTMQVAGKMEVLDKDGKKLQEIAISSFKANSNNKVLEVTPSSLESVDPAEYSVKFVDMKDATVRGNALPATTLKFTALDTKKPTVTAFYLVSQGKDDNGTLNADKDTITIYFSEAMDVSSIENLANYLVGGLPLTTYSNAVSAKAASDAKSVAITYKGAFANFTSNILVVAVKDVAGNIMSPIAGQTVAKQGNTELRYTTAVGNAVAKNVNTIEVTFSAPIGTVDPALFVVYNGDDAVTGMASATIKSDNTIVEFKTAIAIDPDAYKYTLRVNAPSAIKNVYGVGLTTDGTTAYAANVVFDTLKDTIRPTLSKVEKDDAVNTIKFTFSENLFNDPTVVTAIQNGLLVKDKDNNVVLTSIPNSTVTIGTNKTVTVRFDGADRAAIGALGQGEQEIKVSFPIGAGIVDNAPANRNNILPVADHSVKVNVESTAASVTTKIVAAATIEANATHTLVFSKAINEASRTAVKAAVDAAYTANGTAAVSSAWGTDNRTLTVTITAAADPNHVVLGAIAQVAVTDLVGNTSAALDLQN